MEKIFERIANLMKQRQLYTDPALTRKLLAEALSTNEAYVHRAIRQQTGMTFYEYIFQLRLEHAAMLLEIDDCNTTIETIAAEAGYRSRKTFHEHFRKQYGCTPAQYRIQQQQQPDNPEPKQDE